MTRISNFIKENRLYIIFAFFIIGINLLALAGQYSDDTRPASSEQLMSDEIAPSEAKPMFGDEDIKARQAKIESLAVEMPLLYVFIALVNLAILFCIFLGILIDIYLVGKMVKHSPVGISRLNETGNAGWGIGDVVRVTLIFLFFGYVVLILQTYASGSIAILRNDNFRMVFNTALMNVVCMSVIFYFIVGKYGQNLRAIGITARGWGKSSFYAVAGYLALIPVVSGIMIATYFITRLLHYQPPVQPIVEVFMKEKETSVLFLSTTFAAVFGPVAEEIFFRGFVYGAIKKNLGVLWGMIITSAIFALLHAHVVGFLPIMVLGMLLVYLYEKTGSLVTSTMVHIMHNVVMVFMVFLIRNVGV